MNRLRAYRKIENMNQEELGDILDLSPQMISAIEGGRRPFKGDLEKLGYANSRLDLPDMSQPLHRHRASTRASAKNRAQELLRLAGEVFAELRDRNTAAPATMLERLPPPSELDEIEEFALDARCSLRHEEHGPIRNLTAVIERAGICLVPIIGLEGIDGLSAWVEDVPVIGLSPSVSGARFRHTLAHELAHLMFHTRVTPNTEPEANRFAAALLIPRDEFDAAMKDRMNLRDFASMKAAWGVSIAALVYRAHDLGYIDDRRYRALQIQMSKWRRIEPGEFEPVTGQLLGRLVEVERGVGNVAQKLGINAGHLGELVNWSHLRIA